MDLKTVFSNPEFRAMKAGDKAQVLSRIDPEFINLAPKDQIKVMITGLYPHINDQVPKVTDKGFWSTLGDDALHAPEALAHMIWAPDEAVLNTVKSQIGEAKKAYQSAVGGDTTGTLGHGLAALLPLVGPAAAQAGTEIGEGKTGEGLAHTAEILAPFVAPEMVGGAKTAGRVINTELKTPGTTRMIGGAGKMAVGAGAAIKGGPIGAVYGIGSMAKGLDDISQGLAERGAFKNPPAPPPPVTPPVTAAPPPLRTSPTMAARNAGPPIPPQVTAAPPPIRTSPAMAAQFAEPPMPTPPISAPPPPVRTSPLMESRNAGPQAPPPRPNVAPPPLRQSPAMATQGMPEPPRPMVAPPPLRQSAAMAAQGIPEEMPEPPVLVSPPNTPSQSAPVLNTGQGSMPMPRRALPVKTVSTAPPTPSAAAISAAEALKNAMGGEPGKPLVIPGSDTTSAGEAAHDANSFLKTFREQAGDKMKDISNMPDADKAAMRDQIIGSGKVLPGAIPTVFSKLGIDTPPVGQDLPKFAKGGIVIPSKAEVPEMARSGEDIIRGTSNIPLSAKGKEQAKVLGGKFKTKGGMDHIEVSDLHRAVQTGQAISDATDTPISKKNKNLRPWHLGELEGQPTEKVLDRIHKYITKQPNAKVPGMGPESTSPGESFNTFKRRVIGVVKEKLQELKKNPSKKIDLVTHYRDCRLIQAWASRGFPDSMEINTKFMTEKGNDPPGSVFRLSWKGTKPTMEKVNMDNPSKFPGGVYLTRHEVTSWNQEQYSK